MSSGVYQRGQDDEGVYGFLVEDIKREIRRSSRLVSVIWPSGSQASRAITLKIVFKVLSTDIHASEIKYFACYVYRTSLVKSADSVVFDMFCYVRLHFNEGWITENVFTH